MPENTTTYYYITVCYRSKTCLLEILNFLIIKTIIFQQNILPLNQNTNIVFIFYLLAFYVFYRKFNSYKATFFIRVKKKSSQMIKDSWIEAFISDIYF